MELGIPEDDPRNPAVIADNVGDNVGDVAGMGADLFDSNVASIAAAIVMGAALGKVELIFMFGALGLLVLHHRRAACPASARTAIPAKRSTAAPTSPAASSRCSRCGATLIGGYDLRLWGAAMLGMVAGVIIGFTSEFFTGDDKKPVENVARACQNGPAFTILSGFSYGLWSTLPSMAGIGLAALLSYKPVRTAGPGTMRCSASPSRRSACSPSWA